MIAITTTEYDLSGYLLIDGELPMAYERRVAVTRTLDGGIVAQDFGWNIGDRSLSIDVKKPTQDQVERAQRMSSVFSSHRLFGGGHVYKGVLTQATWSAGNVLRLYFQITETEL